jgi:hypothetical protein
MIEFSRLSTGGNISGRVSFAHVALSNGKILQESTLPFRSVIDLIEKAKKKKRS